jgi:hypothetical protein
MGVTKIQNSDDYIITRYSFWKFWKIDELEINLPTRYSDAYHEVEKKSPNGTSYSIELKSWVIDDVREQLYNKVHKYQKLVNRSKKLRVNFRTSLDFQFYSNIIDFYFIDGGIYFDSDESIKREKLLNKLGI